MESLTLAWLTRSSTIKYITGDEVKLIDPGAPMLIILNTGDVVSKDTKIIQISSAGTKQKSTTGDLTKFSGQRPR